MKLAAYLRVSTDRQAEEGLGLDVQREQIKRWAKDNGHRVVEWFTDAGVSGSNGLDTRQGLPEALGALRSGEAQGLVVYRLDRLARDLVIQETLLAEVRRLGAEMFTTSASEQGYLGDDPDDPSRKLIRQVLGAVNEYERSMIALRLRSGRRRKAEQGGFAYGSPPFGYRAEGGELVPDPDEQVIVEKVRLMADADMSLRQIAEALNSAGHRPRRGQRWHPQTVSRMMQRFELADR